MKSQLRSVVPAWLLLNALLLAVCDSPHKDPQLPLRCLDCSFVESRGVRVVSGRIKNDSGKTIELVRLTVNFQDARGNTVVDENIALPIPVLKPQDAQVFSVPVSTKSPAVTQAIVTFETPDGREKLSSPVALLLIVRLEPDQ